MKKALKPSFQLPDQPTLALGGQVLDALVGNTHFTTPNPPLAQVQTALDEYSTALNKSEYGGRGDHADKNAKKKTLISLLRELCDYVNSVAKGDEVILSTCGYPLSKDPQPIVLGTPVASVANGGSGELISSTPGVKGAAVFRHQYTTNPSGPWDEVLCTRATCKITGLVPGQTYYLRIVAIGTGDQVTISNVVVKVVT